MLLDHVFDRLPPDPGTMFSLYLISHTDSDTKIFESTIAQIQRDLGISDKTISRYFKILQENGTVVNVGKNRWYVKAVIGDSDTCDGPNWYVTKGFIPKR